MTAIPCRRGEVWTVDFKVGRGSEQTGVRPALVIQNDVGNRHAATTIVAAITSTLKEFPVTVLLDAGEAGMKTRSMVNLAQVLTLDRSRLRRRLGALPPDRMAEVDQALMVSLGLDA